MLYKCLTQIYNPSNYNNHLIKRKHIQKKRQIYNKCLFEKKLY